MTIPVTLHVRTEPYEDTHDEVGEDFTTYPVKFDGNKVIGEVRRGDEVLFKKEVITNDSIESVGDVSDNVALDIEIWAVENTDYEPDGVPT